LEISEGSNHLTHNLRMGMIVQSVARWERKGKECCR